MFPLPRIIFFSKLQRRTKYNREKNKNFRDTDLNVQKLYDIVLYQKDSVKGNLRKCLCTCLYVSNGYF